MFLVAGVSGHTGRVVASTLLAQGKKVRVFARDAAKAEALRKQGAEVAVGELDDVRALTTALEGTAGAYLLIPPMPTSDSILAEQAVRVDRIARAVEASRVGHVVFLSSVAAHLPTGTGPIRSVHYAERRFGELSTPFTFLRAAYFLENDLSLLGTVAQGFVAGFTPKDLAFDRVATADIGAVAARALVEGAKRTEIIELAGPRETSLGELAATLSRLVGKPLEVRVGPEEAIVPTFKSFGVSDDMAALYREMLQGIASGRVTWQGHGTRFVRGSIDAETFFRGALKAS
mgnify:CR=1 FL=1